MPSVSIEERARKKIKGGPVKYAERLQELLDELEIHDLGLTVRTEARLEEMGITTIRALLDCPEHKLREGWFMGDATVRDIKDAANRWLAGVAPPEPPLPRDATDWQPGSHEKLLVMVDRADRGEQLFHPEDGCGRGRAMESHGKPARIGRAGSRKRMFA